MSTTWWVKDSDLDNDQKSAVQGIDEGESFLIRGPAGSGKTNILLLRSKWLRLNDINEFRIVVFTRTLSEFIKEGCEEYGVPQGNVTTSTHFLKVFLAEYGIPFESTGSFESDRILLAGKAQALIESKGIKNDLFEALLIDECQDYLDTELLIFRQLTKRLVLAADARQSIYKSSQSPDLLESLVGGKIVTLTYHYRSGIKICKVADSILRDSASFAPMGKESLYEEAARPSSVELFSCESIEAQYHRILSQLPSQLDGYPDELIGVLFPKKDQLAGFVNELEKLSLGADRKRVRVDTMHGAKGLEFRAVHLGGCEALYKMGPTQKRLIYTSILRGRTAVAMYYTGNIPGYLESAMATLSAPKPPPKFSDLFKK